MKEFKEKLVLLRSHIRTIIPLAVFVLVIGSLQMTYWKYVSDKWLFDSYISEDFKLSSPYLMEYLFSYKKGWLLYTPIMILPFCGFYFTWKKNKAVFYSTFIFTVINLWILSSWDCWWYADSFSQRSIVQSYPVLLIPFGYAVNGILERNRFLQLPSAILVISLVLLNLFQIKQLRSGVLHTSRMTKDYYWAIFGKTDIDNYTKAQLLEPIRGVDYIPQIHNYSKSLLIEEVFSPNLELSKNKSFSAAQMVEIDSISEKGFIYFKGGFRYNVQSVNEESSVGIVFSIWDSKSDKEYGYRYEKIFITKDQAQGQWLEFTADYGAPYIRDENDLLRCYIWLNGDAEVEIDRFLVDSYDVISERKKSQMFYADIKGMGFGNWQPNIEITTPIDSANPYSRTMIENIDSMNIKSGGFKISVSGRHDGVTNVYAVIEINKFGKRVNYLSYPIKKGSSNSWAFEGKIQESLENSELKLYLWNNAKGRFFPNRIKLEFLE